MTDSNNDKTRPSVEARPAADIFEGDDDYRIVVDIPGVDREQVSVTVDDGRLTLRATRGAKDHDVVLLRTFKLADDVDTSAIEATIKSGVLTLELRKRRAPEPKRIQIKVA